MLTGSLLAPSAMTRDHGIYYYKNIQHDAPRSARTPVLKSHARPPTHTHERIPAGLNFTPMWTFRPIMTSSKTAPSDARKCIKHTLSIKPFCRRLRTRCPRFEKLLSVRERGGGGEAGPPPVTAAVLEKVYSPEFLTSCNSYPLPSPPTPDPANRTRDLKKQLSVETFSYRK